MLRMKRWLSLATLGVIAACEPLVTTFDDIEEAIYYEAASITSVPAADTLVVMTWNIKFGGGGIDFWFDCHGDRVLMTKDEVISNMDGLVQKILSVNPDVILLQEVDVDSKRSAYVDQLQYLLDHTDLNYGVYASMWQVQYIPSDGLGRMNTGTAILAKWPLEDAERIPLALREDQDSVTKYFYLRRNILKARLDLEGQDNLQLLSIHAAAFSQDGTKQKHIDQFKSVLDEIDADGGLFLAAGDLNTIPPGVTKLVGFDDSICEDEAFQADDYTDETDWLSPLYSDRSSGGYWTAVPHDDFLANNADYFTHSTQPQMGYKRKIDYIFTNSQNGYVPGSDSTHHDIGNAIIPSGHFIPLITSLSDHTPISVMWVAP